MGGAGAGKEKRERGRQGTSPTGSGLQLDVGPQPPRLYNQTTERKDSLTGNILTYLSDPAIPA